MRRLLFRIEVAIVALIVAIGLSQWLWALATLAVEHL